MRDNPTQGKQLGQQSITANRRKEEREEPCSRESGGAGKHGEGRPESPPRAGEQQQGAHPRCDGDSKNNLPKGVTAVSYTHLTLPTKLEV